MLLWFMSPGKSDVNVGLVDLIALLISYHVKPGLAASDLAITVVVQPSEEVL